MMVRPEAFVFCLSPETSQVTNEYMWEVWSGVAEATPRWVGVFSAVMRDAANARHQ